jgi:hypothetical protein
MVVPPHLIYTHKIVQECVLLPVHSINLPSQMYSPEDVSIPVLFLGSLMLITTLEDAKLTALTMLVPMLQPMLIILLLHV